LSAAKYSLVGLKNPFIGEIEIPFVSRTNKVSLSVGGIEPLELKKNVLKVAGKRFSLFIKDE
jgi:hypothetical protein